MATTTYEPATRAEQFAEVLIDQHHQHLLQARIVWLRTTTGQSKARVCNALLQHAFGKDSSGVYPSFVVVVTQVDWARHRKRPAALIDALLCSMTRQNNADTGKDRWAIAKPDVSMFLAVVKRHGLSTTEEQQVGKMIKDLPEQMALPMDGDDQDDDEDPPEEDDRSDWPEAPAHFGPVLEGPTREEDWETATRPDVSPEALSRIRGSVESAAR